MIDLPIQAPRYLERFRCLGPACGDSCCSGEYWTGVPVDPTTVAAYQQLTVSGDRRALRLNLVGPLQPDPRPDPNEVSPAAFMVLERGATCQFLSAERGCTIHEAFGEALSALDSAGRSTADVETAFDLGERCLSSVAGGLAEGPGRPHRVLLRPSNVGSPRQPSRPATGATRSAFARASACQTIQRREGWGREDERGLGSPICQPDDGLVQRNHTG